MNSFISKHRHLVLFVFDVLVFWATSFTMYLLMFRDNITTPDASIFLSIGVLFVCILIAQVSFRVYASLWRYASTREFLTLAASAAIGYAAFLVVAWISRTVVLIPVTTLSITSNYILLTVLSRLLYRYYRDRGTNRKQADLVASGKKRKRVVILGAGDGGVGLLHDFQKNLVLPYETVAFFDDDPEKLGRRIGGVPVKGPIDSAKAFIEQNDIDEVVFAIPSVPFERRREILRDLQDISAEIKILPDTAVMLSKSNDSYAASVRSINIDDLLGRNPVSLDTAEIRGFLTDKVVLVTGGGGSIGSELVRQIATVEPRRIIIFDIAENSTYLLRRELNQIHKGEVSIKTEIGSVRDPKRLDELFATYRPDIVFHAAAHKHVPLMEWAPEEAVKNNIFGTWNVMQAAKKYNVAKFVLISTDKAVSPTSVMGATKRYCEMMLSAMAAETAEALAHDAAVGDPHVRTSFSAVRFGNVLGSAGSVVPIFDAQIEKGGPVTVTDKEITRFFMTIPEAVSLVLKSGSMAKNGELFVLDMGEPVKIYDLAENLIRLSGFIPGKDIEIIETGLRPGEKLYEELLVDTSRCEKTSDSKIFIEHETTLKTRAEVEPELAKLTEALDTGDQNHVVAVLRELVPTYVTPREVDIH
jgi:FlaA1/EpsC-like NDP-sugar epimerase